MDHASTAVTGMRVLANPGPGWTLLGAQNFGDGSANLLWKSSTGEVDAWTPQGTAVTDADRGSPG